MNCPVCGSEVLDTGDSCLACGAKLGDSRIFSTAQSNETSGGRTRKSRRKLRTILVMAGSAILLVLLLIVIAFSAGWLGAKIDPNKVHIEDFDWEVSGIPVCVAVLSYVIRNDDSVRAGVYIEYLDNGIAIAHDFYLVDGHSAKHVAYYMDNVDCIGPHNYEARIAAVS